MNPKAYEALTRISEEEWRHMALRLARYALGVSRGLRWRTRNAQELPGGETVDSIVSKAIEKLYSGDRDWDPEKQSNLEKHIQGIIDSLLNHLATSQENAILTPVPEPGSAHVEAWERGSSKRDPTTDWLVRPSRSPEAELIDQERIAAEERALELLLDECSEDPLLMKMIEALMDGLTKPTEIAQAKGIPIKDIYNAAKRLDRKLEAVRKRVADEHIPAAGRERQ